MDNELQNAPLTGQRVEKVIYNHLTHSYWHVIAVDLGRPDRVEPWEDWQEYTPELNRLKRKKRSVHRLPRPAIQVNKTVAAARAWLTEHGPATMNELADAILWTWEVPPQKPRVSVHNLVRQIGAVKLSKRTGKRGIEYVWGLKGIHAP